MEYVFILNPEAGKNHKALSMVPIIQRLCKKYNFNYQIHMSESGADIVNFVKKTCSDGGQYRFYACGGDGTLSYVVNGMVDSRGCCVGVLPLGTGNDFIKNFEPIEKDFLDIEKQLFGSLKKVDLIKYNDRYCVNICNIGFDADVATSMPSFKKIPLVTNKAAYNLAIVYRLFHKLGLPIEVYADDELFFRGKSLMCAVSNGKKCGGGFCVSPKAVVDDGFIDVNIVTPPSRLQLSPFVKNISEGTQMEKENTKNYVYHTRCKKVLVKCKHLINLVNDGESEHLREVTFEIVPNAIDFIVPLLK